MECFYYKSHSVDDLCGSNLCVCIKITEHINIYCGGRIDFKVKPGFWVLNETIMWRILTFNLYFVAGSWCLGAWFKSMYL